MLMTFKVVVFVYAIKFVSLHFPFSVLQRCDLANQSGNGLACMVSDASASNPFLEHVERLALFVSLLAILCSILVISRFLKGVWHGNNSKFSDHR
jgi:hypothetical protein